MKITCSRDELAASLCIVSRGLSTRGTVQILAGVMLQVENGSLELAATDMELSLRARVGAQVEGEGSAVGQSSRSRHVDTRKGAHKSERPPEPEGFSDPSRRLYTQPLVAVKAFVVIS